MARFEIPPHVLWPGLIVALLVVGVGSGVRALVASYSDGGVEPVAEYHAGRSSAQRAEAASDSLGWTATAAAGTRFASGEVPVQVTVTDAARAPVTGLDARLLVARPQDARPRDTLALREGAPGTYTAAAPLAAPGLWDVTVEATRGGTRFTSRTRLDVR